jgi:hypothetical protein
MLLATEPAAAFNVGRTQTRVEGPISTRLLSANSTRTSVEASADSTMSPSLTSMPTTAAD